MKVVIQNREIHGFNDVADDWLRRQCRVWISDHFSRVERGKLAKTGFEDNVDLKQVELRLWMVSLMPPDCSEYLQRLMGHDYRELSANEQIILSTAYLEKKCPIVECKQF